MTTVADAQEGNCFGTPSATVSGPNIRPSLPATISVGVILVEFTDRLHFTRTPDLPNGYLKLHFENMLFSDDFYYTTPNSVTSPDGEDVYGSVKDWYQENSHGLIQITGQVVNPANGRGVLTWLNLGSSATYLNNTYLMITTAIAQAVSNNWNCNYNIICVIASQDLNGQSENTWHGSANFGGPSDYRIPSTALPSGSPLFNYNNFMGCYNTFERARGVSTGTPTFRHVGVHVHEIFHTLGLVFLGNWSDQTGVNFTHYATGDWSTMHRTDIGPKRKGECESHLLAARKVSVGWANATDITSNNMAENIQYINTQIDIPNATDFYRFTDNASGEQFVVENRQYTGFNSFLPGWWDPNAVKGGLLIFNTKPYATIGCNDRSIERLRWADNSLTTSYTVGSSDPTLIFSVGDPGDPFPGSNNNTNFSIATTPNSARRDPAPTNCSTPTPTTIGGDPTGFAITNISASVTTMTATFHSSYLASNSVDATASNSSRKIVRDSGGVYHLVYETTGEIYYQKSTDGGSTWGSYKRLSAGNGSSKFPCIAERSGKLFVVWQRNTGTNTYDVLLRHFNGSSWDTNIRTVQSAISSSSPPTPVIAINMPTDPTPEMVVVYRTGSSIKSRRSTSANGSVWEAEKNVTSNTSARNPSLVYRLDNEVPTHKFHVTWDQGSDIYHQSFNGSLNTWTAAADISTDPFASNNQYSSYAIAGNNDRHVVWQALESEVYFHQAIYHSKNLGNAMAMLVSNSYDQLRPSITGHAGSAATALCYDNSAGQNIRKRRYNGTSWEGAALGTIIASNGADASLSIANPPGATALGVWRSAGSAPYALTVGPSGGLSKSSSEEDLLYHRRIAYFLNDSTKLMLQIDGFEMIEDGNKKSLAFSNVAKDSLPAVDLAATMSVTDMLLSPSADSLAFSLHLLSRDAGQLRDNTNLALLAAFEVSSAETGLALANIALPPIAVVGESKQNARLVFPLQALRGQKINLALKLSNLNVAKVNGTLVHVYELAETGAQKPAQEEEALVAETCRPAFAVKIHPNPFNPSTQIHFSSG